MWYDVSETTAANLLFFKKKNLSWNISTAVLKYCRRTLGDPRKIKKWQIYEVVEHKIKIKDRKFSFVNFFVFKWLYWRMNCYTANRSQCQMRH